MRRTGKKLICILLALLLALSACGCSGTPPEEETPGGDAPEVSPSPSPVSMADSLFTLDFDPDAGFNPVSCASADNLGLLTLMYESLFTLDNSFEAQPLLCDGFETDDGITWKFTLKSGVRLHDGTYLTAQDAVYSILEAKSGRYSARLRYLASAEADGALSFTVKLSEANMALPALLDVPVMKNGSGAEETPAGTGPYVYDKTLSCLRAFAEHRNYASLPVRTIFLKDAAAADLTRAFSLREIDMIIEDPLTGGASDVYAGHERYEVNTARLQFVGFNASKGVFADARVRRAVLYAIDRESIAETAMEGAAVPAVLALPSALSYYDASWESGEGYSLRNMSRTLTSLGLTDADGDGFLEMPDGNGGYTDISIDFIVNDDARKTQAAQEIAYDVRSAGLDITVRSLSWDDYKNALRSDEFDMYYGETLLGPDFDLTQLAGTGGSLNYGGFSESAVDEALAAFKAAGADERAESAEMLCWLISRHAPIAPVLYRTYCVRVNRGTASGIRPSPSGAFCGIESWTITF